LREATGLAIGKADQAAIRAVTVTMCMSILMIGVRIMQQRWSCQGLPRASSKRQHEDVMAGTSGAKTRFALWPGHDKEKSDRFD
jgi:hypothetical protein